jgi:hypothetical protein
MAVISKYPLLRTILLWLLITSTSPFIFYKWPGHPYKMLTFFCLLLMTIDLSYKNFRINKIILSIIVTQIIFFASYFIFFNDTYSMKMTIQLFALLISIIYIQQFISFHIFIKQYINVILFMGIGGMIIFFIHLTIGVSPIFSVDYSEHGTSYFLGLTTTNVFYSGGDLRFIRFSGFFDEPGAFGLYSIFAILLNKLFLKDNIIEFLLIITTVFCFSLAFYIFLILYLFFFYFNINKIIYLVSFILISVFLLNFLQKSMETSSSLNKIYQASFARLEVNDYGLVDDSRSSRMVIDKKLFLENLFFGNQNKREVRGANLYSIPASYGLIGTLFYYLILLYLTYIFFKPFQPFADSNKVLLLILMNLYHRPELLSFFASLILCSFIMLSKKLFYCDRFIDSNPNA